MVELTRPGVSEPFRRITLDAKGASRGSVPTICYAAFALAREIWDPFLEINFAAQYKSVGP